MGDTLYFMNNDGEGKVRAKGNVTDVYNSDKMSEVDYQQRLLILES